MHALNLVGERLKVMVKLQKQDYKVYSKYQIEDELHDSEIKMNRMHY